MEPLKKFSLISDSRGRLHAQSTLKLLGSYHYQGLDSKVTEKVPFKKGIQSNKEKTSLKTCGCFLKYVKIIANSLDKILITCDHLEDVQYFL